MIHAHKKSHLRTSSNMTQHGKIKQSLALPGCLKSVQPEHVQCPLVFPHQPHGAQQCFVEFGSHWAGLPS